MGGIAASSDEERTERRRAAVNRANEKYLANRHRMQATFTHEEYEVIAAAAKIKGLAPTTFMHDAALEKAKKVAGGKDRH